mgnify:CR=1 FL=1
MGYAGLVAFALAWIPQSWETIRAGRCEVNRNFLGLAAVGSFFLTLYAVQEGDPVFATLNALTTTGAVINLVFSLVPKPRFPEEPCPASPSRPDPQPRASPRP